jgi:hypothetical protein
VLGEALDDLEALPDDAWEKRIAHPVLLHYQEDEAEESATGRRLT